MKRKDTKKISDWQSEYLSLNDIACKGDFSCDFLLRMIRVGKLKAFMMDKDWLTTQEWLDDFSKSIRSDVLAVVAEGDSEKENLKWFRPIATQVSSWPEFLAILQFSGGAVVIAVILFLTVVVFGSSVSMGKVIPSAGYLAKESGRFLADKLSENTKKISDEITPSQWRVVAGFFSDMGGSRVGRVAGASEKRP